MARSNWRTFTSDKYGPVRVIGIPNSKHRVDVNRQDIIVLVLVKELTLNDDDIEKIIADTFERRRKRRAHFQIEPVSPDFAVDYPRFKMRLKEKETEDGLLDHVKEGNWWVVLYPPGTDFSNEVIQERFFTYFESVLDSAADEYVNSRGSEIADIIGTSIPCFNAEKSLGLGVLGNNVAHRAKPDDRKAAVDQETNTRWSNFEINIKSELLLYPHERIDAVIIHELIHNFFFDHGDDFQSSVDYYCEKILGKSEDQIRDKYSYWMCAPFAKHPLYNYRSEPAGPLSIVANGKRYFRKKKDVSPVIIHPDFEEKDY